MSFFSTLFGGKALFAALSDQENREGMWIWIFFGLIVAAALVKGIYLKLRDRGQMGPKRKDQCANCRRPIRDISLALAGPMSPSDLSNYMSPEVQATKALECDSCGIELCALCCVGAAGKRGLTRHICPRCGGPVSPRGALVLRL